MIDLWAIVLVLIATIIGAFGALLLKKSTDKYSFRKLLTSSLLITGLFLYGLSTILYVVALRREELSVLYPLVSTSYIWTTLLSVRFLGEKMNAWKYVGLVGIIIGVVLIGIGS
ncbi:EamA family transporter [Candidatus Woesearchaeota archaeon]|nr:EamA family transporter [Candidatus Woesearchaeota archaeon]